jgi:4-amino-4-deoxy-L-arabinose transferase-like glycosyltransferase
MRLAPASTAARSTSFGIPASAISSYLSRNGIAYVLLLVVAAAYIAAFAGTGLLRAIYPFPIDGLERGALQEVALIRLGQPIYVAPTLGYVPFIYGPLYYYLAAVVATISGSDLFGLRCVSLLASLGSIALVALLVRRETGSLAMGVVGGALLATCGPFAGGALDIGRVDATSVFFLLAAIYAAHVAGFDPTASWRSSVCSGVLMGLALLTKQSVAPVALALLVLLVVIRRRQVPVFVLGLGVTLGVGLLLASVPTWPWPLFYLWELPRLHQTTAELASRFPGDVLPHVAVPAVVGPFYLVARAAAGDRKRVLFHAGIAAAMIAMAWITRSTIGGARNVELPAYAAIAILFGLGLHEAVSQIGSASARARMTRAYVLAAAIAAFAVVLYNPRLWVPYRSDMWAGQRLAATLAELPGPIFAGSYQGFLGGATNAVAPDLAAVNEMLGEQVRPGVVQGEQWNDAFAKALLGRVITYVIIDPDNSAVSVPTLTRDYGYVDVGPLFPAGDDYWRWQTGWTPKAEVYARPDLVSVPRPAPTGGG